MGVPADQLREAAKEWSESLDRYKRARSRFYDLVVEAQREGWDADRIWRAQMYASRNDINRILASHRRSTYEEES